jgi:hypothetical protein
MLYDNRPMALRWLAKITETNPFARDVLREAADYIGTVEDRLVLMEGLVERLIEDGDRAIFAPSRGHKKAWRETKTLAIEASPDGDHHFILTPGMRVYREPMAREYDEDDRLHVETRRVGVNAYGDPA